MIEEGRRKFFWNKSSKMAATSEITAVWTSLEIWLASKKITRLRLF